MRLFKAFLHTFLFTIYYLDVFIFHVQRGKTFGVWRSRGYILMFGLFYIILWAPLNFLLYCICVACGYGQTIPDVNLYIITLLILSPSLIYVIIRLKNENYIEAIIKEILSTDKNLIKKRYRFTLFTVLIPALSSPFIFLLLKVRLHDILIFWF